MGARRMTSVFMGVKLSQCKQAEVTARAGAGAGLGTQGSLSCTERCAQYFSATKRLPFRLAWSSYWSFFQRLGSFTFSRGRLS